MNNRRRREKNMTANGQTESHNNSNIPVIDLREFGDSYYKKLREACEEWGCFRVINHGLSVNLMAEMKEVARFLLDRPIEIKIRNAETVAGSGYVGPSKASPLCEALGLYDLGSPEALRSFCDQLDASPHQREVIEKYAGAVNQLAVEIGRKLERSMGLDNDLFKGWPSQFRINKYNFTPESIGSCGVRIHTDSGLLTILQEDENVGGLEVMNENGELLTVDPCPGTLLLILGDVAKVWSNGRFCNVKHRVQCKEASIRVSIASFLVGPKEELIEAPQELVDDEHPRLYVPFSFEDYRRLRHSTDLPAGEALELIRAQIPPHSP